MADWLHRLIRLLESKGPRKRQARVQGRAECDMYVYDTTLHHLRTPTDRYHVVLVKNKATFNVYTIVDVRCRITVSDSWPFAVT